MTQSLEHVIIIGSGLGGLTLAQALREMEFHPACSNETHQMDLARKAGGSLFTLTERNLSTPYQLISQTWRQSTFFMNKASRVKVPFSSPAKEIARYEEDDKGVIAYFTDGSSVRGTCFVGADGINSPVRNQLLGSNIKPGHVPMGVIIGELRATSEQYECWMSIATSFFPVYADSQRITIALKKMDIDGKFANYYWLYNWDDSNAAIENYRTGTASRQELHDFVMKNLDTVPPQISEILRATPVEGILHPPLLLRDMVPPRRRTRHVVMAMTDGLALGKRLANNIGTPIAAMIKDYKAEMSPRGTKAVLEFRAAQKLSGGP